MFIPRFTRFINSRRNTSRDRFENESTSTLVTLEIVEHLVREIYNIDWIVDINYKSRVLNKSKNIINDTLFVGSIDGIDKLKQDLIEERKYCINKIRKKQSEDSIIDIKDDHGVNMLFCKKNIRHYSIYKILKDDYNFSKIETFDLINYILYDLENSNYEKETEENLLHISITTRLMRIRRKHVVIAFLKRLCEKKELRLRII